MRVREKINMNGKGLIENGPITIVAFGDSVTHGAVGNGEIDYESVYWHRLAKKINARRNYVPVNVINAGIGGLKAVSSLDRMDRQVLKHEPDLLIICFGLNDVNGTIEEYLSSLEIMFKKSIDRGIETIFMTPNMMNTYTSDIVADQHKEYAKVTAEFQKNGRLDRYIHEACELARKMGVTVCDCYSEWKKLAETQDTTLLLANGINHPIREMHELFADMLYACIFDEESGAASGTESTMYGGK